MDKTLALIIKETKMKLANVCNESKLHPVILDMMIRELASEVHNLAESQTMNEEIAYQKMINAKKESDENKDNEEE